LDEAVPRGRGHLRPRDPAGPGRGPRHHRDPGTVRPRSSLGRPRRRRPGTRRRSGHRPRRWPGRHARRAPGGRHRPSQGRGPEGLRRRRPRGRRAPPVPPGAQGTGRHDRRRPGRPRRLLLRLAPDQGGGGPDHRGRQRPRSRGAGRRVPAGAPGRPDRDRAGRRVADPGARDRAELHRHHRPGREGRRGRRRRRLGDPGGRRVHRGRRRREHGVLHRGRRQPAAGRPAADRDVPPAPGPDAALLRAPGRRAGARPDPRDDGRLAAL
ncbi:MAG: hypothetical protein AVDCRST_MAG52-1571, partial [uncultured Blastococcus sp.]